MRVASRGIGFLSNVEFTGMLTAMLFSGLYRYDEHYEPVPDLADGPCDIGDGGLSIRCRIRSATFHDGSPVTASDVALGFELLRRPTCQFWTFDCRVTKLVGVEIEDDRTIAFRLSEPDPEFMTVRLPTVLVQPRIQVEASFERLRAAAGDTDPDGLDRTTSGLAEALDAEDADCAAVVDGPERVAIEAGYKPWSRDEFNSGTGGSFDPCEYGWFIHDRLRDLETTLRSDGLDAMAAAFPLLDINRAPIGTGPFRFESLDPGVEMRLLANEAYHHGRPAIDAVDVVPSWDDDRLIEAARDGALDLWLGQDWWDPDRDVVDAVRRVPAVKVMATPTFGYDALMLNVRSGRLLSDVRLREALEVCFDKAATVDAATRGQGMPIDSYVPTGSWAYQADLEVRRRDVDAGRALIESAGFSLGDDGIFRTGDRRFSFEVLVREPWESDRRKFLELMALQVRDCGIELIPTTVAFDEIVEIVDPARPTPPDVDAVFGGFFVTYDPDDPMWRTGNNWVGYSSAEVDSLLDEGRSTTDLAERARIYKRLQTVLAEDRPFIFAYTLSAHVIVSRAVGQRDGELDLTTPRWWWRLEDLTLTR